MSVLASWSPKVLSKLATQTRSQRRCHCFWRLGRESSVMEILGDRGIGTQCWDWTASGRVGPEAIVSASSGISGIWSHSPATARWLSNPEHHLSPTTTTGGSALNQGINESQRQCRGRRLRWLSRTPCQGCRQNCCQSSRISLSTPKTAWTTSNPLEVDYQEGCSPVSSIMGNRGLLYHCQCSWFKEWWFWRSQASVTLSPLLKKRPLGELGLYSIHYPRPFSFLPERWLGNNSDDSTSEQQQQHIKLAKATFNPFSIGSRACVAKPLATSIIQLYVASFVWTYDFRISDDPAGELGGMEGKNIYEKENIHDVSYDLNQSRLLVLTLADTPSPGIRSSRYPSLFRRLTGWAWKESYITPIFSPEGGDKTSHLWNEGLTRSRVRTPSVTRSICS